ncbi:hypothetical protein SCLCIDRAFT_1220732 [Scleroderma citrinum Foug A]|uniref:Uncharacterized protein n=1 Tax=Scleroderma citrinum Foug A TaxID=1036808 RepID=A0A0C2ZTN3_9AGAM|nr:hypothetical protein SCLCIDRAFT_1220732 [Scleroderma citrinum Foug A]
MITKDDARGEIAASGLESALFAGTKYSQTEKKLRTREATTTFLRFFGFPTETIETWKFKSALDVRAYGLETSDVAGVVFLDTRKKSALVCGNRLRQTRNSLAFDSCRSEAVIVNFQGG